MAEALNYTWGYNRHCTLFRLFEFGWEEVIEEFNLEDNDWLSDIFSLGKSWNPVYNRMESLSRLMRTTSRSESENHFFGQVCNSKSTLVEFITHYETKINAQRYSLRENDHKTRYKRPELKSNYNVLENQASEIYTKSIFLDIQVELIVIGNCIHARYEDYPDGFVKFFINNFQHPCLSLFEVMFENPIAPAVVHVDVLSSLGCYANISFLF
ncbi:protein FAR1-RELATED SEQUENCE 1-like [Helianthus annuus]|uniref:protein FAR1-RELATED SEQUENCE 1-like n=1 Tax=Helianthus annuus TaxID=4232 RepID=UPI000B8FD311|nr:protein FAR1-RELATED SEQUENCE 1-like [Helianthus annuus]